MDLNRGARAEGDRRPAGLLSAASAQHRALPEPERLLPPQQRPLLSFPPPAAQGAGVCPHLPAERQPPSPLPPPF